MSFSSERLSPQRPIFLQSDADIRNATQVEIDRLRALQDAGQLSKSGAELLGVLQRDCLVHDF
ncbi:MAG TPA: hypothetical protein VF635_07270 [Propionibacteriaceae bacterium]|jgi:hypothetical protein